MGEIVYVLTNEAMPDLVKIGKTDNLLQWIKDLSRHSGVPLSFELHYACEVKDADEVEKRIHSAFDFEGIRINPKREFFRINPDRIVDVLKLAEIKEITLEGEEKIAETIEEQKSINKIKKKRGSTNFKTLNIEPGAELIFLKDENVKAVVKDDKKIEFRGEIMSLSRAAEMALNEQGIHWAAAQGPAFWKYEGEILYDRRLRLEDEGGED